MVSLLASVNLGIDGDAPVGSVEIESVVLWRVHLPLLKPHSSAYGSTAIRDLILVECVSRGSSGRISGWGECPTFAESGYVTETTSQAWAALGDHLAPLLVSGQPLPDDDARATATPAALGSLRDAALDAGLRAEGTSLVEHLGAMTRPLGRTSVVAAVADGAVDGVALRALAALEGGAELVKVKVTPATDFAWLKDLAAVVEPGRLAIDANGSFGSADIALKALRDIDSIGLRYIEEPFGPLGWDELAMLIKQLQTPVALDESVRRLGDIHGLVDVGCNVAVSIKPAKVAGVMAAAEMVAAASDAGLGIFVGGMVETAVGRRSALALASLVDCSIPTDLGPSEAYFEADVAEAVTLDGDGRISASSGPGFGPAPDLEQLTRVAVDRVEIAR